MVLLIIILSILLLCLILSSGLVIFSYNFTFKPLKNSGVYSDPDFEHDENHLKIIRESYKKLEKIPYENIYIKSEDDLTLHGRYYHIKDDAPIRIMFHGYKGYALRDFSIGALDAIQKEHNVILIDQRGHAQSEGYCIGFGMTERYDCKCWADYTKERFGENCRIILSGISMGAATVLMASDLDLPKNVVAITADCPYSNAADVIKFTMKKLGIPSFVFPFVRLSGMIFGHFDIVKGSAIDSVRNTDIPILLVHGDCDTIVPVNMSRKLFRSIRSKEKDMLIIEGADHGMSFIVDPVSCSNTLDSFIEKQLKK